MKYYSFLSTAQFRHVEYFFLLYHVQSSASRPLQSFASRHLNTSPPGISLIRLQDFSILRFQASQSSACRPPQSSAYRSPQSFASRHLNPPPPGLFNPSPSGISILRLQASLSPAEILQFLHFDSLLTSPSTSSKHLPTGLPTGLLPSIYPLSDISGTLSPITLIT